MTNFDESNYCKHQDFLAQGNQNRYHWDETTLGTIDHAPLLVGSIIFLVASHICSSLNTPLKYVQSQVAPVGFDFASINCPLLIFVSMFGMVEGDLSPISIIVILSVEVQNLVRISLAFEVALFKPIPKLVIFTAEGLHGARKHTITNLKELLF